MPRIMFVIVIVATMLTACSASKSSAPEGVNKDIWNSGEKAYHNLQSTIDPNGSSRLSSKDEDSMTELINQHKPEWSNLSSVEKDIIRSVQMALACYDEVKAGSDKTGAAALHIGINTLKEIYEQPQ